jgi:hypothetical protein
MWSKGFNVSYTEVGARTSCQTPAGEPKKGVSGKPAAVRMDGKAVRKMIVHHNTYIRRQEARGSMSGLSSI